MRFYNQQHDYYCWIDLHARILAPFQDQIVVGVECMHCWYWISDLCLDYAFDFVLGHALYMKAIHGGKTKNDRIDSYKIASLLRGGNFPLANVYPKAMQATRDLLRRRTKIMRHGADLKPYFSNTFSQYNYPAPNLQLRYPYAREKVRNRFNEPAINRNLDIDLNVIAFYTKELASVEHFIEQNAKQHNPQDYQLLQTVPGICRILAQPKEYYCLLPIAYCLLPIAYCLLPIAYCLLTGDGLICVMCLLFGCFRVWHQNLFHYKCLLQFAGSFCFEVQ